MIERWCRTMVERLIFVDCWKRWCCYIWKGTTLSGCLSYMGYDAFAGRSVKCCRNGYPDLSSIWTILVEVGGCEWVWIVELRQEFLSSWVYQRDAVRCRKSFICASMGLRQVLSYRKSQELRGRYCNAVVFVSKSREDDDQDVLQR